MSIKLDEYEKEIIGIVEEISYYLQKSGAGPADSQDIAQDVLVKLLESDIVLPFEKLRAWLYRSAVRAYIDKYRRDKRYHEILQKEFLEEKTFWSMTKKVMRNSIKQLQTCQKNTSK